MENSGFISLTHLYCLNSNSLKIKWNIIIFDIFCGRQ